MANISMAGSDSALAARHSDAPPARSRANRVNGLMFAVQALFLLVAGVLLAFMPPATGPVLVVPLSGSISDTTAPTLNLSIIGSGPFPGSLVMTGNRPDMLSALFRHHLIIINAIPSMCSNANAFSQTQPQAEGSQS